VAIRQDISDSGTVDLVLDDDVDPNLEADGDDDVDPTLDLAP
jgi:hypothetical protein